MSDKPTYKQMEDRLTKAENELKELRTLYNAATAIGSSLSLLDTLECVAVSISESIKSAGCVISLWHRDQNKLETLFDYNRLHPDETEKTGTFHDLREYPSSLNVLETGQLYQIQVNDPKADKAEVVWMIEQEVLSLIMLPLKTNYRTLGLLEIYEDVESREYTNQEMHLAENLAFQAAGALENAQLYAKAQNEILERKKVEKDLEQYVQKLEKALLDVRTLEGFIPICASCKKVRDDSGYWNQVESYIKDHSDAEFSHSICPDCAKELYPDLNI